MRSLPSAALAAAVLAATAGPASAATITRYDAQPHGPAGPPTRVAAPEDAAGRAATSPSDPTSGQQDPVDPAADPSDVAGSDSLAANGLGGAMCRNPRLAAGLSAAARRDCLTAGTVAAGAPVDHYGFDVHIDTGTLGLSSSTLLATVQTLLLTPLWTSLVWLTHATLSALEWSFALDLLDPATMGSVARTLASLRATVTEPWLLALLAVSAMVLLYHGIVRRRVADSVGETAAMTLLVLAGLWVITHPDDTVGAANRALNQTGLGAVAAVSAGDPASGRAAFGDGLRATFATAIQGPWCYLEFGDVDWCRNPRRLDPRLAKTARALQSGAAPGQPCPPPATLCKRSDARDPQNELVAEAKTNGELFLAFPANHGERNSVSDERSLYRTLCASDDDNHCRGPTAPMAAWRTESGTWPRAGGLMLITVGVAGMLALLGFIALRLLGAAILTVVYLLLAPLAVLAPTVGEGGRAAFRGWAARLLGALVAKLIYALFLGVVLLTLSILNGLGTLGWWTQWLLIGAFWWIVFAHRHEVLAYARLGHAQTGERGLRLAGGLLAARQLAQVTGAATSPARRLGASSGRSAVGAAVATRARLADDRARLTQQRDTQHQATADTADGDQVKRTLDADHRAARATVAGASATEADLRAIQSRRARLADEIGAASARGEHRRARRLVHRDGALRARSSTRATALRHAEDTTQRAEGELGASGQRHGEREIRERGALLDREAAKRRGVPQGPRADRDSYRDYPRLAGLADLTSDAYRALGPAEQRRARLTVDRELAARHERAAQRPPTPPEGRTETTTPRPRPRAESAADRRRRQLGRPQHRPSR